MQSLIGLLAVAGVLVLAACASREPAAHHPAASETSVTALGVVPWVDRPALPYVAPTPTPTSFPTDARPCRAADLTGVAGDLGAALGTSNIRIRFTNRADTACVLLGYPSVAGISADGTVTALDTEHGSIIGDAPWPAANIAPGQTAAVNISGGNACEAALRGQHEVYPTLRIKLPAGDVIDVANHGFDTVCGVGVSRFGVPALAEPPQEPRPSRLTAQMSAPVTAHAGGDLVYTVTLRNRSDTAYSLTPCPAYEEYVTAGGGSVHPNYYLNCDTVHEIPVGGAVTYEMRLRVPADFAGTGPAKFGWLMEGEVGPGDATILQITK